MSSIRKREWQSPTGEIKTAWQVDYRDSAGKRRSKQFPRKKEAERWLTTASWQVAQGVHTADSQSVSVAKAAQLWLDGVRANNREPTTVAAYEQQVRLHIVPVCGAVRLSQLTAPMVRQFLDRWQSSLSRPMATRVFRSFRAVISDAQERGLVAQNVALAVRIKKAPREKGRIVVPTKADLRAILHTAETMGEQANALMLLLVFSGLRASELRGLTWTNIDLRRAQLHVTQRADAHGDMGNPKSRTSHRTIPLPPRVVAALKAWKLACPPNALQLVFPSKRGKPMPHGVMMKSLVTPVQQAAGTTACDDLLKGKYTLHEFRHAAASMWIDQGLNPKRVQTLMGHSSIQMTFDTYGHLFEHAKRDADDAQAIERALFNDAT